MTAGGVAARAGLTPGLIVARINAQDVATLDDVGAVLDKIRSGEVVTLVVVSLHEQQGVLLAQSAQAQLKAE